MLLSGTMCNKVLVSLFQEELINRGLSVLQKKQEKILHTLSDVLSRVPIIRIEDYKVNGSLKQAVALRKPANSGLFYLKVGFPMQCRANIVTDRKACNWGLVYLVA